MIMNDLVEEVAFVTVLIADIDQLFKFYQSIRDADLH